MMQINSEPTRRQLMDQVKQQTDEIERLREEIKRLRLADFKFEDFEEQPMLAIKESE